MKSNLLSIIPLLMLCLSYLSCSLSCSPKIVPTNTIIETRYIDSIAGHDSTIVSYLTKEVIKDIVPIYDTLKLETSYSKSISYVDTTYHILTGTIENKSNIPIKTEIKWKEKVSVQDSIVYKEIPVPVEVPKPYVPKIFGWSMAISILWIVWLVVSIVKYIRKSS